MNNLQKENKAIKQRKFGDNIPVRANISKNNINKDPKDNQRENYSGYIRINNKQMPIELNENNKDFYLVENKENYYFEYRIEKPILDNKIIIENKARQLKENKNPFRKNSPRLKEGNFKAPISVKANQSREIFSSEKRNKRIKVNSLELNKNHKSFNFYCSNFSNENQRTSTDSMSNLQENKNSQFHLIRNKRALSLKNEKVFDIGQSNKNAEDNRLIVLNNTNNQSDCVCFNGTFKAPNSTRNNYKENYKENYFIGNLSKTPDFKDAKTLKENQKEIYNNSNQGKKEENQNLLIKQESKVTLRINTEQEQSFDIQENKTEDSNPYKGIFNLMNHANEFSNAQIPFEYFEEILEKLKDEETKAKFSLQTHPQINENVRFILINWISEVHRKFKLKDETLYQTIYIIDYCKNKQGNLFTTINYQLLGITALYISCKFEEIYFPSLETFSIVTANTFDNEDILQMEYAIMGVIDYSFHSCYPLRFLELYKYVFELKDKEFLFCKFCVETVLFDESFYEYHFSTIVISVVFSFLKLYTTCPYKKKEINSKVFVLSKNRIKEFKDCLRKMVKHLDTWVQSENPSIFKKKYDEEIAKIPYNNIR